MKNFFLRVQNGDTIYSICNRFNLSPFTVIYDNNLKADILEGDIIYLDTSFNNIYTCMPFDNYQTVAEKLNVSETTLKAKNKAPYLYYGAKIIY